MWVRLTILFISLGFFVTVELAPVAPGPDFENISYLHNLSLIYSNNSLDGLSAIDEYTDVDAQMAASLKDAINRAVPAYVSSKTSAPPPVFSYSNSIEATTSIPPMIGRMKRSASNQEAPTTVMAATTQPYGTDEEFYARTDLVHFHVDIDNLEGSGS